MTLIKAYDSHLPVAAQITLGVESLASNRDEKSSAACLDRFQAVAELLRLKCNPFPKLFFASRQLLAVLPRFHSHIGHDQGPCAICRQVLRTPTTSRPGQAVDSLGCSQLLRAYGTRRWWRSVAPGVQTPLGAFPENLGAACIHACP